MSGRLVRTRAKAYSQVTGRSDTHPGDESPSVHDSEASLARGDTLKNSSNSKDEGSGEETPLSSEVVTDRVSRKSTDGASSL